MKTWINKGLKTPLYLQLFSQIKEKIISGDLLDGYALPSERTLAKELGIHRNTVVKAYNELKMEELITAYQGIGYRVTYESKEILGRPQKVNWANMVKEEYLNLDSNFDDLFEKSQGISKISFGAGIADSNVYHQQDITEAFTEIIRVGDQPSYFYTPYQGDLELRKEMSKFLRTKGILVNHSQIQVFSENNQVLDFLVTICLSPGDKVIMEESSSPDVFRAIELAGGKIITVPMDDDGLMCQHLEPLLELHKPKFIYVNSSFHNPTGVVLSLERRKKLLELSYQYRVPIIEEDEASELFFKGKQLPTIKSMDRWDNVIYMHSFSLTMIPGVGVSFVVAPKIVVESLSNLVSVRLITLEWMPQKLVCHYLKQGIFNEKLMEFKEVYKKKQELMCQYLEKAKETIDLSYSRPSGGVFLWVKLPPQIRVKKLESAVEKRGVTFMPGEIFFPNKNSDGNYIRLNYSYPTEEELAKGMKILIEEMQKIQKKM
ncbi:MAG: PLP-dependent aminotransferase family protein [Anaerovoracaceae bacterium]